MTIKLSADLTKTMEAMLKAGESFKVVADSLKVDGLTEGQLVTMLADQFNPEVLEEGFDNKGKKVAKKPSKSNPLLVGSTIDIKPFVLSDSSESVETGKVGAKMSGTKIEWWATKNIMKKKVEIAAFVPNQDGSGGMAGQPMMFKSVKEGDIQPSALELTLESAQALVDALWAAGITPSQYSNQSAELKAVREHLADIKQVAFSFLDLKK